MYMAKQTHNQRIAEMANKLRYEGFETEIAKKLKEEFPDIKEIRFDDTAKNRKMGFYWSTFQIIADWTENQPESERHSVINYNNIQDIQTHVYSMILSKSMYKYQGTGKTVTPVLVTYSTGKNKEV
ncbi:hypothetical protein FACS1894193_12300 [Bacilli bacterium]|nr:hypothetical protein FACS1894193_12300 [Bacilli bacterium]